MFGSLSEKFVTIISSLKGRAIITEQDLDNTLREVRIALLEADVALVVVKDFISRIKENNKTNIPKTGPIFGNFVEGLVPLKEICSCSLKLIAKTKIVK